MLKKLVNIRYGYWAAYRKVPSGWELIKSSDNRGWRKNILDINYDGFEWLDITDEDKGLIL